MSPEIIFPLKSSVLQPLKEDGKEPDKLFNDRFKTFKVVELIAGIEPVHKNGK